jgi:predicted metal-dependent enzyme (double-stranded beta helix superfamily)
VPTIDSARTQADSQEVIDMLSPAPATTTLADVVSAVRDAVRQGSGWETTSKLVAEELRRHLPGPEILTAAQREGDPAGYLSHLLHAEPDGSFSIVAMVWLPGQVTSIHDHVTWCVFGVLQGIEHEELFTLAEDGQSLLRAGRADNTTGEVSGFAPPGDVHRVRNIGDGVTISLHIYGADISRLGCSIRREYDLPIR